ncbi:unnamed protein product [Brassicogethes aeneus]|uniref:AAA+ ATPase domain-containing protein n=1 Tax=Brassicogethes aeneus TaxID=1431903 RepID=A0A9P0FCE5_BRAAE|nr:unnamed protein product [Brassicogethes aeneus]
MEPQITNKCGRKRRPSQIKDASGRLLRLPPIKFDRDADMIPFHIPHKSQIEKVEYKKKEHEPLSGFLARQEKSSDYRINLPSIDAPKIKFADDDDEHEEGFKEEHEEEEGVVLPHHKLKGVADQSEWIQNMRQRTDGGFVYFTFIVDSSSEHYTPYAVREVPYSEVDKKNFFTMSAKGVLQHIGNEAIFTSLEVWEAEYNMYCRLMRIKSFFRFRMWKGFYVWRKAIIFKKYSKAQRYINNNLFILNPIMRDGLLNIRQMCVKMTPIIFTDVSSIQERYIFYFVEDQMRKMETIQKKLEEFREVARDVILSACYGALLAKGFVVDERKLEEYTKSKKGKKKEISHIDQANKKKFCMRLSCFITLCDYLMVDMMHDMILNSVKALNEALDLHFQFLPSTERVDTIEFSDTVEIPRETHPMLPLVLVSIMLSPEEIFMDPPLDIVIEIIDQVIDLWIHHTTRMPTLVGDDVYLDFTKPVINLVVSPRICGFGPGLAFYLAIDENLKQYRQNTVDFFTINYNLANVYLERLGYIRDFFAEDLNTNEEVIQNEINLEVFRSWCIRYRKEEETIENLLNKQPFGILYLQFEIMKKNSLPEPRRLRAVVEKVLPWIGKIKIDKLVDEVNEALEYLEVEPVETIEFVHYLEYLEKATALVDDMEVVFDYCKDLYDILEEFEIQTAVEEINNYLSISVSLGNLRNFVDKKLDEIPKIIKKFTEQLNKDSNAILKELGDIKDLCMQPWLYDIDSNIEEVKEFLSDLHDRLQSCLEKSVEIKNYQKQFRLEVTRFDVLDEVMGDVKLRELLWESVETWAATIDEWYHADFNDLNVEDMNTFVAKNIKNINQLEKGLPKNLIVPKLRDEVEIMKNKMPVITYLRNPTLKGRHWIRIENILNYKFKPEDIMTLEMLESLNVFNYPDDLMEVSGQASSEAGLEALLKKVEEAWEVLEFPVIPHKDAKDVYILGSLEEVQAVLDESNININTIASSRHVGPIKNRVDEWAIKLDLFSKILDEWYSCQQSWIYLEIIFSAPDIQRQLPNESKMFLVVDKSWKEIMRRTAKMPLAMEAAMFPNLLETFKKNNENLDNIMKCLESYLETKRVAFPRFYFLSNDELLDILAQTRNPHAVQPHLRKCFDAIAKLEFGLKAVDDNVEDVDSKKKEKAPEMVLTTDIIAMLSPEGERVPLGKGLKARGNVEDWLGKVEESMFFSLRRIMKASLIDYASRARNDWVVCHPNQVILTVSQIKWAQGVHQIFNNNPPAQVSKKLEAYEAKCITDLNNLAVLVRSDLSSVTRKILIALITIDVHARDTIHNMVASGVSDSSSFEWLKVLRYYWDEAIDDCLARMSSGKYVYGYEYLGAGGVLVITPLTDRCYLCLMGALQLDLGGAPAGPAGTGKTETTKDLAKALAIQCVVFNCSEGLDFKMMGRFFSGLAQSGAWCCFDEFNRIDIEVLSVIAQQLITIRNAKAAKVSRFYFEGREIKLVQKCAAFITMNPGYAGRTELPDNLKSLFRPISMMVPDYALIAEVILYSEGFESSKVLSRKMVNMYKLCSEQLSQQDHYDFGMRAVKSVLVMAGALKRANPTRNEDVVLICALRDSNLPKFLTDDAILFQGILGDLFPGVELPVEDYGLFQEAIVEVMLEQILQPELPMIHKVIQLYETMIVRWGVMLVGPTGSGKSAILNTLNMALTKMYTDEIPGPYYHPVHTYFMNPKAVTAGELYGEVNPFTLEWRDGLMGLMMRTAVVDTSEDHQWIVCDGPVDAVWIENLNTVLDDNKMLCLANSERIKLTPYVHMVFEVQDLAQASPATVSRCGMVYVDPDEIKWMPFAKSWLQKLNENLVNQEMKDFVLTLFEHAVENGFVFIKKNCVFSINQVEVSKVKMLCNIFESYLQMPGAMDKIGEKRKVRKFLCQTFVIAYLWGLGGNLTQDSKDKFESCVRDQFDEHPDARLPTATELWGVYVDVVTHKLEIWQKIIPKFRYNGDIPFFEMLVPTIDTVRYGHVMERLIYIDHPVLLTGDTGVGKSVVAKAVLNALQETNLFVPVSMNFSAQTSSFRTQEIIELKLDRKKKTLLGAPVGKKVVIFVDDVNMPKLETYGAQPPIELLRQFLDYGGLYDREKLFWKKIQDVIITSACAPPGGGRNPLTPRFIRHFGILLIPPPNEYSLKGIFRAILKGFFKEFSNQVRDMGDSMVNAAVDIYDRIATDLLPTPAKSHYVFNLRDLSKCIQGITQADPGTMREERAITRLFYHECLRVFHDRLINVEDKSYFYFLMKEICNRNFGTPVLMLPEEELITEPPVLLFGDFMTFGAPREDRLYEEISNLDKVKHVLQDYLDDFNLSTAKEMDLIFFLDAVEHCVRLARILRSERGNALLVGVGGMGKQSLTKLSSHVNGYKCYQIELTRNYDHASFFEDLRKMYFTAGGLNENTVFLFTDTQIVQEEFLEDINNILNSGEVPNLFESDELERCIIACRDPAKHAGVSESNRDGIFEFFINRVRANLHLVLCMSPVGDAFRRRCRMFPSLVNCCTIDWFDKWPEEALVSVALNSLKNVGDEAMVASLGNICVTMHKSMEKMTDRFYKEMKRHYYITPSSYLELIKLFKSLLTRRKDTINKTRDKIDNGLKKIYETNEVIDSMKETLIALEPELAKKSQAAAELMVYLAKEQKAADKVRNVVKGDEENAKEKATVTQAIADDAQKDLDTAMPALEAAVQALSSLNKNDINEVKAFNNPPKLVQYVMESVCILLNSKITWDSAKKVLGDTNFLKKLQEYDKNNISDVVLKKLHSYIVNPDFVPEKIANVSKACKSLCMWVRAMDMYAKVFKVVEPKRKKLAEAEKELNQTMALLRDKQKQLADVEAMIAGLEATFAKTIDEKQALEDNMELTANRLNRAGRLNVALGDEQTRWEESVKQFAVELNNAIGDAMMAAGCVAYLGAFTNFYRVQLVNSWERKCKKHGIPASSNFSLINILADQYEIRMWNTYGLPRDLVSTENAILVTKASRWPLMIDPQEQACRWIKNMEAGNTLQVIKLTDGNFMRILESAVRIGMPVLLEEVGETLDPTLGPILLRQTFVQGGRLLIHLGDSDVEYDQNFKFYITTKLSNPHYLPEICIQVTIVNFTVTPSGLEDQLLADVVRLERPDLEEQRNDLVVRINTDKNQLKGIEDKILFLLYNSKGNILDDEELIETLNESKETSAIIEARLVETEATEEKISIAREKYRSVATRGSVLYFVVAGLSEIDPMYQYSLKYFSQIFNNVIVTSAKNKDLNLRLQTLYQEITLAVYTNVSRGLFERHKLVYSFMLNIAIYQEKKIINEVQLNYLLRGPIGFKGPVPKKPDYPLITEQMWMAVNFLSITFPKFKELPAEVVKGIKIGIGDYSLYIQLVPGCPASALNWNAELDDFEKLLLLKTLKEEKVVFGITEYVRMKLGQVFIESPLVSLNLLYLDTSNAVPLIFVLSTGSDPFGAFQRFAIEMNYKDKIKSISLGQGQGPVAEKLINDALISGEWVFLQNCHLATSWMLSLERIVLKISENAKNVHESFRLYMSSMPSKSFPVSVLQNSVKVTNEPPKGLRANVKRAFTDMTEDFFKNDLKQDWHAMLFGLCMFHAIIQERKKFGPLGWNITYEFNDSDREFGFNTLKMFCENKTIPWDALEYLTGEITYGGRVTDYWDLRCLKTILKIFFSPQILAPGYVYSKSGTYFCPQLETLQEYRDFIEGLPIMEEPEIFGMHENANIAYQIKETQNLIGTIMESQPQTSGGAEGASSDEIVYELAENVIATILPKILTDDINVKMFIKDDKGRLPSLTTVLTQEIDRYNILLKLIHSSMGELKKAIKGFVVMSDALEEVFKAFMNNQVPKMWSAKCYNSLKSLGSWVHDLALRLDFISMWVRYGHPISYWISGFYFPQGFLTGTLQTHARKYNLPIDELKFDFIPRKVYLDQEEVYKFHVEEGKENFDLYKPLIRPNDGVIIHGLFVDAGRWDIDLMKLVDAKPGEISPPLVALTLVPSTHLAEKDRYPAPLYKTSVRAGVLSTTGHSTNFVIAVLLPSNFLPAYWILKGTALLTQITD